MSMIHSGQTTTPFGEVYFKNNIGYLILREDLKHHMTIDEIEQHYQIIGELTGWKLLPFIVDVSKTKAFILEYGPRKLVFSKYYKYASCYAYISEDIANTFFLNLFCKIAPKKVPMKIFSSEKDATEWIQENNIAGASTQFGLQN